MATFDADYLSDSLSVLYDANTFIFYDVDKTGLKFYKYKLSAPIGVVTTGRCINHDSITFTWDPVLKTHGYNKDLYSDNVSGYAIFPLITTPIFLRFSLVKLVFFPKYYCSFS